MVSDLHERPEDFEGSGTFSCSTGIKLSRVGEMTGADEMAGAVASPSVCSIFFLFFFEALRSSLIFFKTASSSG